MFINLNIKYFILVEQRRLSSPTKILAIKVFRSIAFDDASIGTMRKNHKLEPR